MAWFNAISLQIEVLGAIQSEFEASLAQHIQIVDQKAMDHYEVGGTFSCAIRSRLLGCMILFSFESYGSSTIIIALHRV